MEEIRRAALDDYDEMIVLEAEIQMLHHQGEPTLFPPVGVITREDYAEVLQKPDEGRLVAVEDGEIVGYLDYELIDGQPNYYTYPAKSVHVSTLTIKETHRRRGYGEALMDRVTEIAREFGAVRVTLDVYMFNEGAYRFYERRGFRPLEMRMTLALEQNEEGHIS